MISIMALNSWPTTALRLMDSLIPEPTADKDGTFQNQGK